MPNILVKGHMRFDENDSDNIIRNILGNNDKLSVQNFNIDQLYNHVSININKIETAQIKYKYEGKNVKDRENVKNDIKNSISALILMAHNLDYNLKDLYCE